MENSVSDNWLEIVGFPNYRINSNTLEVKNILRNTISGGGKRKQFTLYSNNIPYTATLPRLLFSAIKGISPKVIPANIFIVMKNNRLMAYSLTEYLYKTKIESKRILAENTDPLQTYREERDFIDKVIVSLETGNMDFIFNEIYKHNDNIISYLLNQGLVCNKDAAREIASCSLETTIEHIISGKVVFKPLGYVKNVARFLALNVRKEKSKQREFFDNIAI